MASSRTRARLEARIKERVAHCIGFEISDPRAAFITIMNVEISSDLMTARVFYTVYGSAADRNKVAGMLEGASGFIRKQVARVLNTRRVPHLLWAYDDSVELAAQMDEAITSALVKDRAINPEAHPDNPVLPEIDAPEEDLAQDSPSSEGE